MGFTASCFVGGCSLIVSQTWCDLEGKGEEGEQQQTQICNCRCERPLQPPRYHVPGATLLRLDGREPPSKDVPGAPGELATVRMQAIHSRQENQRPGPLCQGLVRRWELGDGVGF